MQFLDKKGFTMQYINKLSTVVFFSLLCSLTLLSCDDNPVEDDDHDHAPAEGLVLEMNGTALVTVHEGQVTGTITVAAGEKTDHITVEFTDHDGQHIHTDELGSEFSLGWTIADEAVAEFEHEGRWGLHIHGLTAGNTTLEIRLNHGEHADFRTPAIPIQVTD